MALVCVLGGMTVQTAAAQAPSADDVTWSRMFRLTDGRTFVTDGKLMLDSSLVDASEYASAELITPSLTVIEGYLAADLPDEFGLDDLERDAQYRVSPSGVGLSAHYVEYLEATPEGSSLRLKMKGELEPIVIVSDGKAVGLIMAMRRP